MGNIKIKMRSMYQIKGDEEIKIRGCVTFNHDM